MAQLKKQRVRLALNLRSHDPAIDKITGALPLSWNGIDTDYEFALFDGSTFIDDLTTIAQIEMKVHRVDNRSGPSLVDIDPLALIDLDDDCTEELWDDDDATHGKHGVFSLTAEQMTFSMEGHSGWRIQLWLAFFSTLGTGEFITNGGTQQTIEEDTDQAGLPALGATTQNIKMGADGKMYVKNKDTGLWAAPWRIGTGDEQTLGWEAEVA